MNSQRTINITKSMTTNFGDAWMHQSTKTFCHFFLMKFNTEVTTLLFVFKLYSWLVFFMKFSKNIGRVFISPFLKQLDKQHLYQFTIRQQLSQVFIQFCSQLLTKVLLIDRGRQHKMFLITGRVSNNTSGVICVIPVTVNEFSSGDQLNWC